MNDLIELHLVSTDPSLQMRMAGIDPSTVQDYAEAMSEGSQFPPIIIFFDGEQYWPADGFHRIAAARQVGKSSLGADIRQGSRREALLFAVGANASHGLRRTQADKRRSVVSLLTDPEWARWTDRQIGKACVVDHKTVGKIRAELSGEIPSERTYTTKHGSVATMNTAAINADRPKAGTITERLLAKVSLDALLAECSRRGVEVVSHAV